ncbi:MAG: hypothetical protein ACYS21_14110 [Planctomycetota bacterium]|jgi:hypothetical protein
MILTLLGMLCDAEALVDGSHQTYVGYCIDMVSATHRLPGASHIWVALSTNVAADYANADEAYLFELRGGTGTDGTDINAGARVIHALPSTAGNDARFATAGNFIWRHTLDMGASAIRYLQMYHENSGTSRTMTIDMSLSPSKPRTDYNIQVESSNVGTP